MRKNDLRNYNFKDEYRTGSIDAPQNLIRLGLQAGTLYRRASGYFSSSVLNLFKAETLDFALSGGKINLMCSPVMSSQDLENISKGYSSRDLLNNNLIRDIDLLAQNENYGNHLSFLSTLIHYSVLEIKLIFLESGNGIFHDKSGYFSDSYENLVSFSGSANESFMAFSGEGNFERISVFLSWAENDRLRCLNTRKYVDDIWNGCVEGLQVYSFPEVAKSILQKYARKNLNDFENVLASPIKSNITKTRNKTLMPHQSSALKNWKNVGKRGILKHATGSGKTITALSAVLEHITEGHPALILVPSELLLQQWYDEIKNEILNPIILRCGGGHHNWRKNNNLKHAMHSDVQGGLGTIVLAINDTGSSDEFMSNLTNLKNCLIVSDEAHSLGSVKNSKILQKNFAFRLGLSATPERYRDPEGTKKLFDFFSGIVQPEVTLFDALKSGRLVPFDYYPILTYLSRDEEEKWVEITKSIINYIRVNEIEIGSFKTDKRLSSMLINRARIAKKAESKVEKVVETLENHYEKGQHWLVYCEDSSQLFEIQEKLSQFNFNTFIYISDMTGSAKGELEAFNLQGGVLLSIRCLDEGVDIPKISHAIIAASSQNPRQFIQRRGRVLRKSPDKLNAVIYDCIVLPRFTGGEKKFDGLIWTEMTRSIEFSKTSRNPFYAESKLRDILIRLGSDPDATLSAVDGDSENE